MSDDKLLRQKAELILKERQPEHVTIRSELDILRLVHELEVHQIELEMQNEELLLAKNQAELATAKYVELYEFAPSGYFILSREGKITQLNLAGSQMLGMDRSQLKNKRFEFLVSTDTRPIFKHFLDKVFSNNAIETCDLCMFLSNIQPRQVCITGIAETNDDECFITMVDITERKRNEKEIILANKELSFQNEEKAKRAAELDIANEELSFQNEEKAKRSAELVIANKELAFQNEEKAKRAAELDIADKELVIRIEENNRQYSEQISINRLIAFQRDRLQEIASLVPGVVYQYRLRPDGTSCFPYASKALYQLFRVNPEEVLEDGSKVFATIHPKDRDDTVASIQKSAKDLSPWQQEYRVKFEDGTNRTLLGNSIPRMEKDGSVLWHGFTTDVTDRKRMEHQLEDRLKELQILFRLSQLADEKDICLDAFYQSVVHILPEGWQYPEITCARIVVDGVEFCTENFKDSSWKQSAPIKVYESVIGQIEVSYLVEKPEENEGPFLIEERKLINSVAVLMKQIIKRKKAEGEGVRQLALINSMLDSIPDIIFFKDLEGIYLGCNTHFYNYVGKSRSEIVGKTDYDLFEKEIADSYRQFDLEMLKQKLPRHNEEWVTYADGKMVLLDTHKTPYWASDGNLIGILGISRDITERKIIEEELKKVAARLALATRSGGVGVWDYDIVNDILVWDDQMYALYGIQKTDIRNTYQFWQSCLHPEDTKLYDTDLQNAMRDVKEYNSEFRVVWPDGSVHNIRVFAIIQRDNFGKPLNMIGTNWDITAEKRIEQEINHKNEELQKHNSEKDKFFSIIAHDLRGPLGTSVGLTEILADESYDFTEDYRKELISALNRTVHNVFNLLENLLEWSQTSRGLTEFKPQNFDLMVMVTECLDIVTEPARGKAIELVAHIPNKLIVFADKNMLLSVLRNLLSNAIKFTPNGGQITISAKPTENQMTVIQVKDTGIGMSDEMRNNLFNIDAKNKRLGTNGEKSTGLGLMLCKEFVEKLGGKIRVESEQKKGSVFSFTIPSIGEFQDGKVNEPDVIDEGEKRQLNNLKILIAEDDEISAKLIFWFVKGFSRDIFQVKTGIEAVELCLAHPDIDVVLMDIALPEMDGYEATRQIRQFNASVLIVAQTTYILADDRKKALEAGCNDYIAKPFGQDALIKLIKKHLVS
ncbi:PAS domain S-box protein [bacterium]|nr:PAS domain S-box protein [bacterium]